MPSVSWPIVPSTRLSEAIRKIESLEDQIKGLRESRNQAQVQAKDMEAKFAARLESASARLESVAKAMAK